MTLSFTAPVTTPDQEKQERESLDEAVRQSIENDVYGKHQDLKSWLGFEETEETRENGKQELQTALDAIEYKEEYLHALHHAPEVVQEESDALSFLRFHKYDAKAAANGIVEYWSCRKSVFGEERFCQPMTMEGAMSDYREPLNKCVFMLLPDADKYGRPVYYLDRSRLVPSIMTREESLRLTFYYLQWILGSDKEACHRGYVAMVNLFRFDLYKHTDRITAKRHFAIWRTFPLPTKAIHALSASNSVTNIFIPIIKFLLGKNYRLRWVDHQYPVDHALSNLSNYGFEDISRLPAEIGGGLRIDGDYADWLESRRRAKNPGNSE